jgi:NADH dehydrogenase
MILVTGGTGFVGKALIRHLVDSGYQVRTLLRPSAVSPNLPRGVPVEVAVSSLKDERGLRAALKGVDIIFHLVGAERQGVRGDLLNVDAEGTRLLSEVAARAGVDRMLTLSHLGADRFSAYPVLKAKAIAEHHLMKSGVNYTIFRSGVVFGPGDQFTTALVKLIRMNRLFFLLPGDGRMRIQPVWVEDIVACMTWALQDPTTENKVFTLGGLDQLTFRQVAETVMRAIGVRRQIIPISAPFLRRIAVYVEHNNPSVSMSTYWLDYLSADRICPLDSIPRQFGLMPARFHQQLDYLNTVPYKSQRKGRQLRTS